MKALVSICLQNDFFLGKCFEAMEVDSLSSSHPVSTPVENPAQIQEMFDDVSYDKVQAGESYIVLKLSPQRQCS